MAAGYATASNYTDNEVMFAVGFLEGALTHQSVTPIRAQVTSSYYLLDACMHTQANLVSVPKPVQGDAI